MLPAATSTANTSPPASELESAYKWVAALANSETRENALLELCKKRESVPELAPLLWNSCGSIAALLQEICAIYPYINPPNLNAHQSNRVCNALALLQCLASHHETRSEFLKANIPLYLYTFLNTNNRTRPFEYLRLTSLGVIGALVKTDEPEVIAFLLGSEIIPLCLVIMESGSELSKTVATFIMQKLLLDDVGLAYICQTYDRFVHVATVLSKMVSQLAKEQSLRLLKHVIRCYLRLSDDARARNALGTCLPQQLTDGTFASLLESDIPTKRWLSQLLRQVAPTNQDCPGDNMNSIGKGAEDGSDLKSARAVFQNAAAAQANSSQQNTTSGNNNTNQSLTNTESNNGTSTNATPAVSSVPSSDGSNSIVNSSAGTAS